MATNSQSMMDTWSAEATFKAAVLNKLRQLGRVGPRVRIASEFVFGTTGVRADLAVFGRNLLGVEIKTERDSLKRLERQLEAYRRHCDGVILAVAPKHVVAATQFVPDDVELWTVRYGKVESVRAPKAACVNEPDFYALLTQAERARRELETAGTITRDAILKVISRRFDPTSDKFWSDVKGRRISAQDIGTLSRFRSARETVAHTKEAQRLHWESWESQASQIFGSREWETA